MMAKGTRLAARSLIELPSTAAAVNCHSPVFQNAIGEPDQDFLTYQITAVYNGVSGELTGSVSFARNALLAGKQTAIRLAVNAMMQEFEPGNSLNNANIQISGLPV
jgi:hypothetical protein